MQKTRKTCDWCKEFKPVSVLTYADGKGYHSCDGCLPFAELDVRMFNRDEKLIRKTKMTLEVA